MCSTPLRALALVAVIFVMLSPALADPGKAAQRPAVKAPARAERNFALPKMTRPREATPEPEVRLASAADRAIDQTSDLKTRLPEVVAMVNNQPITRDELAKEALKHYGREVLDAMVHKAVIEAECLKQGVAVAPEEVAAEIDRLSARFKVPKIEYLKMLERERGIRPEQYATEIVWPTLALRKLAGEKIEVTSKEIDEAYEAQFGRCVKTRMIVVSKQDRAIALQKAAAEDPDSFPTLAKNNSEDVNSAAASGLVPPIRKHMGDKSLEKVAFALKEGDVSKVVKVGPHYVILRCEGYVDAVNADRDEFEPLLRESIRDRKLRSAAAEMYNEIVKHSTVENYYNDDVSTASKHPGVAAVVNGRKITVRDLSDECVIRNGQDVLEGAVHRRILEQAVKKKKIAITSKDIEEEIVRAARGAKSVEDGAEPDIKTFIQQITAEQGITEEVYRADSVWPSVALKKLVGGEIKFDEAEVAKSYESNYGARVRCRAIVCNTQRKAVEVWGMLRKDHSAERFAAYAKKYSIEPNSASLGGEIPPIRKHGGQPKLEAEVFTMKSGELSDVIQMGDNWVVLLCEGRTKPEKTSLEDVRPYIERDLRERKLRQAMAKKFDQLKQDAAIDNYLSKTIKPAKEKDSVKDPMVTPATVLEKHRAGGRKPQKSDLD